MTIKITFEEAEKIRRLKSDGFSYQEIATQLKLQKSTVFYVVHKLVWQDRKDYEKTCPCGIVFKTQDKRQVYHNRSCQRRFANFRARTSGS